MTYEFTALPFGLSTAPFIFTKILQPVVAYLRRKGFQSVVYLDDFLFFGSFLEEGRDNVNASLNLLISLGFRINYNKSHLESSSNREYLGFTFDSNDQSISIPPRRREKLLRLTTNFARKPKSTIREFAS